MQSRSLEIGVGLFLLAGLLALLLLALRVFPSATLPLCAWLELLWCG